MQLLLNPKPPRRPSAGRQSLCASLRALPLLLLNCALAQVANAQNTGAPAAAPSALYSLVSTLSIFAFFALLVGLFRPKTFTFLFHEKATRGRVCGVCGAAWFFLVVLAGPLAPKRAAPMVAQNAPGAAAPGKDQSAVRLAENRARAAEARAARAEKASANANANRGELEVPAPESAAKDASLPSNVEEANIPNVGRRQLGEVDEVVYMIVQVEKAPTVGGDYFNKQADGMFYVLRIRAVNTAKKTHNLSTSLMKLVDDQDREFDPSSEAQSALNVDEKKSIWSSQLQPGVTRDFNLVYDAPADAKGLKLHIPAGFGFGQSADIRVPTGSE